MPTEIETGRARLIAQELGLPSEKAEPFDDAPQILEGTVLRIELEFPDGTTETKTVTQPFTMPLRQVNHALVDAAEGIGAIAGVVVLDHKAEDGASQNMVFGTDIECMKRLMVRRGLLAPADLKRGFGK